MRAADRPALSASTLLASGLVVIVVARPALGSPGGEHLGAVHGVRQRALVARAKPKPKPKPRAKGAKPATKSERTPIEAFRLATEAYRRGSYAEVIELLRPLLYPTNRLKNRPQLLQAHKMLGISYVFERNRSRAEESFLAILAEKPKYQLDPLVDPPAAVRVFNQVKLRSREMLRKIDEAQRREEARRAAERKRRAKEIEQLRKAARRANTVIERTRVKHSYWLNFLPFGVGQFQNGQLLKGFILMGLQAALGGLSLGMFVGLLAAYPNLTTELREDTTLPQTLNTVQIVSGSLFFATVLYGIVDALFYYRPEDVTVRRYQRKLRLRVAPQVSRNTIGGALELSF